jgi:hypothetical protein
VNRSYSNACGRFMTPDAYTNGGRSNDPQSWNQYAYTGGDPVNRLDPTGRDWELTCSGGDGDDDDASCGSGGVMASVSCGSVYVMAAIDGVQMPSPCDFIPVFFAPTPPPPECEIERATNPKNPARWCLNSIQSHVNRAAGGLQRSADYDLYQWRAPQWLSHGGDRLDALLSFATECGVVVRI